jgi:hypothetical protein
VEEFPFLFSEFQRLHGAEVRNPASPNLLSPVQALIVIEAVKMGVPRSQLVEFFYLC